MVIKTIISLIGVVLCIPLTMSLKFAFENSDSTRWIAMLLASEKSTESAPLAAEKGT